MVFTKQQLEEIVHEMFAKMGATEEENAILTDEIVRSNLSAVDSHGIRNVPLYHNLTKMGKIIPGNKMSVVKETPSTFVLDANETFGHVGARKAVDMVIDKAKKCGIACGVAKHLGHVGRLGSYTDRIASEGLLAIAMCGLYITSQSAPFGASETRFGTNPLSWAAPRADGPNVMLDMATTVVAESKVRGYYQTKMPVSDTWILDADGNPSTDPAVIYERRADGRIGSLQPVGGYKGSGLALFANLFGIALADEEYMAESPRSLNGLFLMAVDPDCFFGRAAFEEVSKNTCAFVKTARPKAGNSEVLVPGELEARAFAKRSAEGVEIPQGNLDVILETARELKCAWPAKYGF